LKDDQGMKTIVLTGATSGIGREVALRLLHLGHRVIANSRDLGKSEIVATDLNRITGNKDLIFIKADFSDFHSVKAFADSVKANFPSIDVLINNAGTWEMEFNETVDGIETNLQVNHLSPMMLTLELMPLLVESGTGRIVNTSSGAHRRNIFDMEDMEWRRKPYNGIATYSQSKLFNILFSLHLEKIIEGKAVTVNTVHPGFVRSDLFKRMGPRDWIGVAGPEQGARSTLYAALSPELDGISGKYIYHEHEDPNISELARDAQLAEKLWEKSMHFISPWIS
jgi:NAD(P)-dependent dehydrogenase (short-subunit alcohol dehydrogenase family)